MQAAQQEQAEATGNTPEDNVQGPYQQWNKKRWGVTDWTQDADNAAQQVSLERTPPTTTLPTAETMETLANIRLTADQSIEVDKIVERMLQEQVGPMKHLDVPARKVIMTKDEAIAEQRKHVPKKTQTTAKDSGSSKMRTGRSRSPHGDEEDIAPSWRNGRKTEAKEAQDEIDAKWANKALHADYFAEF